MEPAGGGGGEEEGRRGATGIEHVSADSLEGVTVEAAPGTSPGFGHYFDRFNPGQRKALVEAVVQEVTVEGPARAQLKLDLPTRPVGSFDRAGSNYRLVWWPQRDETPNGIPAEVVVQQYGPGPGIPAT